MSRPARSRRFSGPAPCVAAVAADLCPPSLASPDPLFRPPHATAAVAVSPRSQLSRSSAATSSAPALVARGRPAAFRRPPSLLAAASPAAPPRATPASPPGQPPALRRRALRPSRHPARHHAQSLQAAAAPYLYYSCLCSRWGAVSPAASPRPFPQHLRSVFPSAVWRRRLAAFLNAAWRPRSAVEVAASAAAAAREHRAPPRACFQSRPVAAPCDPGIVRAGHGTRPIVELRRLI